MYKNHRPLQPLLEVKVLTSSVGARHSWISDLKPPIHFSFSDKLISDSVSHIPQILLTRGFAVARWVFRYGIPTPPLQREPVKNSDCRAACATTLTRIP